MITVYFLRGQYIYTDSNQSVFMHHIIYYWGQSAWGHIHLRDWDLTGKSVPCMWCVSFIWELKKPEMKYNLNRTWCPSIEAIKTLTVSASGDGWYTKNCETAVWVFVCPDTVGKPSIWIFPLTSVFLHPLSFERCTGRCVGGSQM